MRKRKGQPQAQPQKPKRDVKRIVLIIICIFVLLASLSAVLYPVVAEHFAAQRKSEVRTNYEEKLNEIDTTELDNILAQARAYNDKLAHVTSFSQEEITAISGDYSNLLNASGNGIMCYVDIPIIKCYLPVYHGDDPKALERGVEHLYGTSLPVGGADTHSVLSAHTGLTGEKMFTDLELLEEGDVFYLHVLNDTLAYQVDQIKVVEPTEVDDIRITEGEDYVTLITCTPYAVNTHRLLVRGTRIPYEEATVIEEQIEEVKTVESNWEKQYFRGIMYGIAILLCLAVLGVLGTLTWKWVRKRCRKEKVKGKE